MNRDEPGQHENSAIFRGGLPSRFSPSLRGTMANANAAFIMKLLITFSAAVVVWPVRFGRWRLQRSLIRSLRSSDEQVLHLVSKGTRRSQLP